MSQPPLEPADPAWARSQLPPLPETASSPAALSERAELVGLVELDPQIGWGNTHIEVQMNPLSLLLGFVVGCLFMLIVRG